MSKGEHGLKKKGRIFIYVTADLTEKANGEDVYRPAAAGSFRTRSQYIHYN